MLKVNFFTLIGSLLLLAPSLLTQEEMSHEREEFRSIVVELSR